VVAKTAEARLVAVAAVGSVPHPHHVLLLLLLLQLL
jgi:hypothetical protein